MTSLILRTATRFLITLLLLFSVFLLLRGHNEPGGGFVGGLVASIAIALFAWSSTIPNARRILKVDPKLLIGTGLLAAAGSGVLSLLFGQPFLTTQTAALNIPGIAQFKLSTPLLFDVGVYLVVVGMVVTVVFSLGEE